MTTTIDTCRHGLEISLDYSTEMTPQGKTECCDAFTTFIADHPVEVCRCCYAEVVYL